MREAQLRRDRARRAVGVLTGVLAGGSVVATGAIVAVVTPGDLQHARTDPSATFPDGHRTPPAAVRVPLPALPSAGAVAPPRRPAAAGTARTPGRAPAPSGRGAAPSPAPAPPPAPPTTAPAPAATPTTVPPPAPTATGGS
jgi:hypothetical protein